MTAKINMRGMQESVEDSAKQVRKVGRKALLASLGVAGLGYDLGMSVIKDGSAWLEKAEKRGKVVENDIVEMLKAYRNDFPGEVRKLAQNVEGGVNELAKDVTGQVEKVGTYVQKLSKGSANAVVETVEDIQVSATRTVTKAANRVASKAQDSVKEMKVVMPATVQSAVRDAEEIVESAVNALWSGYDELSVKDIVAGLGSKSINVLEQVRQYEIDRKNRVTVIREIDARLQAMTS